MAEIHPQIVAVGEVLWDEFPDGVRLGGAPANFAVHTAALGGRIALVSRVGADAQGQETLCRLSARGVDTRYVQEDPARPTGRVVVTLQEGKPSYQIVEGVAWDAIAWAEPLTDLARRAGVVCFGTLAQRHPDSRGSVIRFVRETQSRCLKVLDINFRQHYHTEEVVRESLLLSDVLKLSDDETPVLRDYLGGQGDDAAFLSDVRNRFGIDTVIQTLGAAGCRVFGPEGDIRVASAPQRVVNTVGAGDAFTAAYVLCRIAGRDALTSACHANRVGGYVTTQDSGTPALPEAFRI